MNIEGENTVSTDPESLALARIAKQHRADRLEAARVQRIIDMDRGDRAIDARRKEARIEVAEGKYASLDDAKDGPTREQLASGEFVKVAVDNPLDTVREPIRTVKRLTRVEMLYRSGVLDRDLFAACKWYRQRWELSGLDPLVASTFDPRYGSGAQVFGHMGKTPAQVDARSDFRWAQSFLPEDVRGLFDAVVIREFTLKAAAREVQLRYANAPAALRRAALKLFDGVKSELTPKMKGAP